MKMRNGRNRDVGSTSWPAVPGWHTQPADPPAREQPSDQYLHSLRYLNIPVEHHGRSSLGLLSSWDPNPLESWICLYSGFETHQPPASSGLCFASIAVVSSEVCYHPGDTLQSQTETYQTTVCLGRGFLFLQQ